MNKLSTAKRAQILSMLVEGMSMRSVTRVTGVSINTVTKLMNDAGSACAAYHDEHVREIRGHRRVECDEIWSFVYAKERAVVRAKAAPDGAGDVWTFTAIDADSKLILSYLVAGERDGETALAFMDDLRSRLDDRPQLTTDGLTAYLESVEGAFGGDVDFAQVIKVVREGAGKGQRETLQPAHMHGHPEAAHRGEPEHAQSEHVLRRASEPHDADGDASVHTIDQWIQQAHREALGDAQPVFRALQFLPHPQDVARHAGD